ncbi:MAG: lytic murein transglycosylase [Smithellaceae bacterium]|nr:lytic murein transglycosylase [Smithellaceae bacterium]
MKKKFIYLIILINILFLSAPSGFASEPQRRLVEELLIAEGLDPSQVQRIMQDPRVSVRPDIVIKNLFFSSPKGTAGKPDVMAVDPRQIKKGRTFMKENTDVLSTVENLYGASPRIITAILIIESRLGSYPMPYNVVNAYANLAFLLDPGYLKEVQDRYAVLYPQLLDDATIARSKRKAKWAVGELFYLVHIANHLDIDPLSISGSFAGALGPAQFIPSSFWIFGIDGDRDGMANPFNMTDANLSMGHYLKKHGWREDAPLAQKRKALWFYNRSDVYVNTVMMIYEQLGR